MNQKIKLSEMGISNFESKKDKKSKLEEKEFSLRIKKKERA